MTAAVHKEISAFHKETSVFHKETSVLDDGDTFVVKFDLSQKVQKVVCGGTEPIFYICQQYNSGVSVLFDGVVERFRAIRPLKRAKVRIELSKIQPGQSCYVGYGCLNTTGNLSAATKKAIVGFLDDVEAKFNKENGKDAVSVVITDESVSNLRWFCTGNFQWIHSHRLEDGSDEVRSIKLR